MRRRLATDHWLEHCRVSPSTVDQVYEIRTHELLHLLDNPDPWGYFDRAKLLSLICRYNDVCGASYFVPQRSGMGLVPKVLWPLYSQYVQPIHEAGSPLIARYIYFADMLPFETVLRFRLNDSLRDPYGVGYSPLYAAVEYAKLEDAFVSIQDQLLSSGPRPNIVFSPKNADDPPGEVERQRFETDLNRKLSAGNAGRVYVSNGAWDVTPISYSPTDLAGKDLSEYNIKGICSCFGIPPTLFTTDTNLANIEAARLMHAENAVEPRCHMIASVLTRFARQFDPRLFFAFDPVVKEDEEKKNRIMLDQLKAGAITGNEFNAESQWPLKDYLNEPWIPSSLQQPSMIQATHQMTMTSQASQIENDRKANEFQYTDQLQEGEEQPQEEESQKDMGAEARSIALDRMIDQEIRALEAELGINVRNATRATISDINRGLNSAIRSSPELRFMKQGNPYHDDEGHFTGTGGHTGRKPKEPNKGRPKAKEQSSYVKDSIAEVDIGGHESEFASVSGKLFGRELKPHEIANLSGAQDGHVSLEVNNDILTIKAKSGKYEMVRSVYKRGNEIVLKAESFHVKEEYQGKGIGSDVFSRMVDQATKLGIPRIETYAAKWDAGGDIGYFVWPKFGYDCELSEDTKKQLQRGFKYTKEVSSQMKDANSISDLMKSPGGSEWWKKNGEGMRMSFDLKEGSLSRQVWEAYQKKKTSM
jgi:HK97 family phage portal protein